MNAFFDYHHYCYYKGVWEMNELREIRENPRHKVLIHRMGHIALHRAVECVPPLSVHLAGNVIQELKAYDDKDPLTNLDNLQSSINYAKTYPRTSELEKRIAELTIYALDLQKPFIKEYAVSNDKIGHPQSPLWRQYGKRT